METDYSYLFEKSICKGQYDKFFPEKDDELVVAAAKNICSRCPVRNLCLDYALEFKIEHGIWGGYTERERRNIAAKRFRQHLQDRQDACPPDKSTHEPLHLASVSLTVQLHTLDLQIRIPLA